MSQQQQNQDLKEIIRQEILEILKNDRSLAHTNTVKPNKGKITITCAQRGYHFFKLPVIENLDIQDSNNQIHSFKAHIIGGGGGGGGAGSGAHSGTSVSGGGGGGGGGGGDGEQWELEDYKLDKSATHIGIYVGRGGKGGKGGKGVNAFSVGENGQNGQNGRPSFIFSMYLREDSKDFGVCPDDPNIPAPKASICIPVAAVETVFINIHQGVIDNSANKNSFPVSISPLIYGNSSPLVLSSDSANHIIKGQTTGQPSNNIILIDYARGGDGGRFGSKGETAQGGDGGNLVVGFLSVSGGGGGGAGTPPGSGGSISSNGESYKKIPVPSTVAEVNTISVSLNNNSSRPDHQGTIQDGQAGETNGKNLGGDGGNSFVSLDDRFGLGGICGERDPPIVDFPGDPDPEGLLGDDSETDNDGDLCSVSDDENTYGIKLGGAGGAGGGNRAWRNGADCTYPEVYIEDCEECVKAADGKCNPLPEGIKAEPGSGGGGGSGGSGMYAQGDKHHRSGDGGKGGNGRTGAVTITIEYKTDVIIPPIKPLRMAEA